MERKQSAIDLVANVVGDTPTAEMVIERLQDEGFLHLGYGKAEVDQIVGTFKEVFNTTKVTTQDRYAAVRLANTHTGQVVTQVIKMLAANGGDKYAPTVGSVAQLEEKWVNVLAYLRKNSQQQEVVQL